MLVGSGTTAEPVNAELIIGAAAVADRQLQRSGAGFTKDDDIAILLVLEPSLRSQHAAVAQQTVENLRAKIRTLVYDPERFVGSAGVVDPHPSLAASHALMWDH